MTLARSADPDDVPRYRARRHLASVSLSAMTDNSLLPEEERKRRVAYVIRRARETRGLTPPQLAERVGRGRGTVNDWEAGRSTPERRPRGSGAGRGVRREDE